MATSSTSILKSLYAWFKGDQAAGTIYTLLTGRLYYGHVPANVTFPYMFMLVMPAPPGYLFTSAKKAIETIRVQFTLVSDKRQDFEECSTLLDALRTRFDEATLTFTGNDYTGMNCKRDGASGPEPIEDRVVATQDYIATACEV